MTYGITVFSFLFILGRQIFQNLHLCEGRLIMKLRGNYGKLQANRNNYELTGFDHVDLDSEGMSLSN